MRPRRRRRKLATAACGGSASSIPSRYASLHPGYYVIFQGVYGDEAEASSALQRARSVFPSAYQREIVP